jgi:hypothetical protein
LRDDDPARAEEAVRGALDGWPRDAFYMAHFFELMARAALLLYTGRSAEALGALLDALPRARRSMLLRVPLLRAQFFFYLGRAAIAESEVDLARRAAHQVACIDAPMAHGIRDLLVAAAEALVGRREDSMRLCARAVHTLEEADTPLYGQAARYRLGGLLGGAEGKRLQDGAQAWLTREDIRSPERMFALLAPFPS